MHLWQGSLHRRKYSCSAASTSSSWSGSLNSIVFVKMDLHMEEVWMLMVLHTGMDILDLNSNKTGSH
ncbi:hypothetical protein V6Z11_A03G063600 [Gossypium hirsutum]